MTDKNIKNEQWTVKTLITKISNDEISKPKFQRKRKWDIVPKNENTPNEKSYIQFLFDTENSVHAITFGQETTSRGISFSNIDGNNRINAIRHFIETPFEIFVDHLDELKTFIDGLPNLEVVDKDLLKQIFDEMSYYHIMHFKYQKYFIDNKHDILYAKIKIHRDEFEPVIEKLQAKMTIYGGEHFDTNVKINVNIFEGYNTDELCKTFEDINKYNGKLTETELLACRLYKEIDFDIADRPFKTELDQCITEYYDNKATGEVLSCYVYDPTKDKINAHDFIVGFQLLCSKKFDFIDEPDVDDLSLFFKLYKSSYGSYLGTFNSENVNAFKDKILESCNILQRIFLSIFTEKITNKLFNNACQDKLKTLKKNNLVLLLSSIIGYINKNVDESVIKNSLEKCLLYHFMLSDLKNKDQKDALKNYDSITYKAGGGVIDILTKTLLANPENISNNLTSELFSRLLTQLCEEVHKPHERKLDNSDKNRNDKRRPLKFFEKTLMFYYYKEKIPTNMLDNEFSIEHICPNSCEWDAVLDKDRTGNLIPIIASMNCARGNKHINEYKKGEPGKAFCNFIRDIVPSNEEYDNIVLHDKKPKIKNNELYNAMCVKNEELYIMNFVELLFP
jgi:hypothetical protein